MRLFLCRAFHSGKGSSSNFVAMKTERFARTRERVAILLLLLFEFSVIGSPIFVQNAIAQNASDKNNASNKPSKTSPNAVLSPEEATGKSLRDFNAIRVLDRDYINNPDGEKTPVDEDDLWLPDLSLGQKDNSISQNTSVRVISYAEDKTTTETRNYYTNEPTSNSSNANQTPAPTRNVQQKSTNNSSGANNRNRIQQANYSSPQNVAPNASVRQTSGLTTSAEGFSNYDGGGFGDYDLGGISDAPNPTGNVEVAPNSFPEINDLSQKNNSVGSQGGFENYSLGSAEADLDVSVNPEFDSRQNISPEPQFLSVAPVVTPGAFDAQANAELSANQDLQAGYEFAPNPLLDDSEAEGEATFTESFTATNHPQIDEVISEKDNAVAREKEPNEIPLESSKLSENDMKKLIVEDIRISGLEMTTQQFNKIIKTRIGAKFSQQRLEEDKRALLQTKQFIDVAVSTSWTPEKPDKVVVNFDLTPRRLMRYVKVVGNKKISKHDLLEELGIKPGESRIDPYEVENGRLRIIEFYKSKDYAEPHVEILRGDRPEDIGVVYLVDEGINQRVLKTSFVGNTVVSAARLRSLVSVKPGVLYFIGGKFTRDRLDADVEKLLDYYRKLGYFDARIDREYRESSGFAGLGKDNAWVTVRYIIDEGPRYKIRNFIFQGNRILKDQDLESKLKVKRGSYYYYNDVEADRIALKCQYQDMGYVRAEVTPNMVFTDEVGVVDMRYDITEDHRYRVRDVIVDYVGTESRTMTPVVLNMLDLTPGELLNGVKIRQSENTLRQSGYFNDKPSEGQLPEIAVIPDESTSFIPEKRGNSQTIKRTKGDDEQENERDEKTSSSNRNDERLTRGQVPVDATRKSYVPYAESRKERDRVGNSSASLATSPEFQSYGPNENANVSVARGRVDVSPIRPFGSIIRAQTTIPSGFSSLTTRGSSEPSSGYSTRDAGTIGSSQYSIGSEYSNSSTSYQQDAYAENNSAPGFSSGLYDAVDQGALEPISPEDDEIYNGDVLIKLQEGRTGMFTASVGVNSDYGLVGNISFTERNFNLFRLPTNLCTCDGWKDAFRGGGQIFNVQASPGKNIQSYRISWDVPYIFHTKNTFGITGLYGDHSYDEWFEKRYGGEIRLGRQWSPRFSTTLNGGIYGVKISDPQVPFVPDLNEALGTHDEFTIGLSAAYDTRNHPYVPSEGYLVKGTVEEILGDYQFPRVSANARYYKTLRKRVDGTGRWVLGLSSNAGWNGSDAPIYERYYGGGSTNLRGFEYRGVTPRYAQTGFGIGGNFEFYNSAELLVPVSGGDEFQLALFVDSGTVASKIDKWGRYRIAPGFGLRFSIPMLGPAPLALDFAFPINKDPSDDTEVFSFSMSGSR